MFASIVLSNKTSKQNWRRQVHKEIHLRKGWMHWGYSKRFGLGISIDRYGVDIDFLIFYIGWQR